jgi:hypothetical protein
MNHPMRGRHHAWDCTECQAQGKDRTTQQIQTLRDKRGGDCLDCGFPFPLDLEGLCKKCQAGRGFKFCTLCNRKRLLHLDYYPGRSECVDCSSVKRRQDYIQCPNCKLWIKKGSVTCKKCRPPAARIKLLRCRWCRREESPEIQFFSYNICTECHTKPNDELRNIAKLRFALKKYGMSIEQYNDMIKSQNGCCKICMKPSDRRLAVDHNHATGKVRGLLCVNCNLGLGNFQDDPTLLLKAAQYLHAME